ncbi:MAG: response regulator [Candidatus Marinimicrobia bacterium]|nr:response regulator [Candidatus Neomarinimicrobiota bacterium]
MAELKNIKFFIVDDDPGVVEIISGYLKQENAVVDSTTSSTEAFEQIVAQKPDCVILDIMMPELDGLELCKQLRRESILNDLKIVILSGKSYEFDRSRAFSFGADGYFLKPIMDFDQFINDLQHIVDDKLELHFWGVRGTLPVSGEDVLKYGGNTNCVSIKFPRNNLFIFDAGTGIKLLSNHLMKTHQAPISAKIFISHPHWDHINALPFFTPLYIPGNEFEICGPSHGDITMRELISSQMDGVYFPIRIKEFAASVYFRDLKEQEIEIDQIKIKTMLLSHPGYCLGYRLEYKDKIICYVTDNELFPETSRYHNLDYFEKLSQFVNSADYLITDSTYTDKEYKSKINWGHSSVSQVIKLADHAKVKKLFLYHHDPDQTDQDIENKYAITKDLLKELDSRTICIAPKEKQHFDL